MDDRCIFCGALVPEGSMICPQCELKYMPVVEETDDEETEEKD